MEEEIRKLNREVDELKAKMEEVDKFMEFVKDKKLLYKDDFNEMKELDFFHM